MFCGVCQVLILRLPGGSEHSLLVVACPCEGPWDCIGQASVLMYEATTHGSGHTTSRARLGPHA